MNKADDYETLWIRAEYETMGWDREPEPTWELELDETGTMLRVWNRYEYCKVV